MQGADGLAVLNMTVADLTAAVRTEIAHRKHLIPIAHDRDLGAVDDAHESAPRFDVCQLADTRPAAARISLAHGHQLSPAPLPLYVRHISHSPSR